MWALGERLYKVPERDPTKVDMLAAPARYLHQSSNGTGAGDPRCHGSTVDRHLLHRDGIQDAF